MDEAYFFPDIEAALVDVMKTKVRVRAGTTIPEQKKEGFVQVVRVGGQSDILTDNPRVTFYIWSASWIKAFDLGQVVRQRILSVNKLAKDTYVYQVREVGGLSKVPDPVDGAPCYQFTVQMKLRGKRTP